MSEISQHQIRQRAYEIWVASGMNDGDAEHHWLRAELAVRGEVVGVSAGSTAAAAKPTKQAKAKAASGKTKATKAGAAKVTKSKVEMVTGETIAPRRTKAVSIEAMA